MTPSPITFTRGYRTSSGQLFPTLDEAQCFEIARILQAGNTIPTDQETACAQKVVKEKDAIMAILTLSDASRPKARGSKRPRFVKEPKTAVAP